MVVLRDVTYGKTHSLPQPVSRRARLFGLLRGIRVPSVSRFALYSPEDTRVAWLSRHAGTSGRFLPIAPVAHVAPRDAHGCVLGVKPAEQTGT